MARSTLHRRITNIERRHAGALTNCPACAAAPAVRYFILDEPEPIGPCARCGRTPPTLTFRIVAAAPPAADIRVPVG